MTSRDVADGKSHRQNGEPEGQGDPGVSDADIGNTGGEHGCAASPNTRQMFPKRTSSKF
jgi:hypothetical protein